MAYFSEPLNTFHTQMKINSTTGSEILTTSEAKDFIRVDTSADDTIIGQMITQARIWCENFISRDIVAKNRTLYLASVNERFVLPFSPVASISSVTVEETATTDYETYGLDDTIIALNMLPSKEVKVTYVTSGQNDSLLKQAISQLVATYYDNRNDFVLGTIVNEVPTSVKNILSSYKNMFI